MKKLSFVIVALVGLVLATGCKKDPAPEPTPDPTPDPTPTYADPTLTLMTGENYLADGDEIIVGMPFTVGLIGTGETVAKLTVTFTVGEEFVQEKTLEYNGQTTIQYTEDLMLTSVADITMKAVLTDTQDKTAMVTVNFKIIPAPEPEFQAHYAGIVNLDATASAFMLSYPINIDYDMDVLISEAPEEGHVNATITFAGNTYNTTGTKDGNAINLEPFEIVLDYEGSTVNATIDMSGTIVETVFSVQGTLEGSGTISFSGAAIPATIEGTVSGDLDKIE